MATQPTNLPVPSESPRDLKFNAGKIDEFVTSLVNTYVDRLGNEHYTIEGLRWLAQQAIAQYGWILIDSFQTGADITLPNQALRDEDTGEYYRWDGALPKHVDAGSTPASAGGVGVGAWLGIGDASLRAMLAASTGAGLIGFGSETVESALSTLPAGKKVYDLIIVYGQSNAVGWAQDTPGFPTVIHDKAKYFNPVTGVIGKIIKAIPSSSGQTSTGHGWASFANEYIRLTGRGVVVVNGAYGGTAIADLAKPATPGTTLYDKLTAAVNSAKTQMTANNLPIGNTYAIWNQGEQDAVVNTSASVYRAALNKLIDDMSTDFSIKRFIIQTLSSCYLYTSEYKVARIQQAQRDVAAARSDTLIGSNAQTRFTVNNGLLQSTDNVHYTQRGYNIAGKQLAGSVASINFDDLAAAEIELDLWGGMLSSGKRRTKLTHVRVKKSGGSWGVYSENDSTGSYTQQGVDGANLVSDKVQIPFLGAGSPFYSGEVVTPNRAMQQFNLSVIGAPVTIDSANGVYGREYQVFANLNFTVNSSGGMSVSGGSADQLAMVQGCVGAVQSGSTVTLTLKGGACYQYPVATAFGAGSIFANGTSTTTVTINFAGGATGALVNWPNVPVPLSAVPNGCEFSCVAFIGSSTD